MYSPSRIKLLSDQEIEVIYAIPEFNKVERSLYFSLTTDEEILFVNKYRTVKAKIYFIRLLGYFKAKQQFYKFDLSEDSDTQYILEKHSNENIYRILIENPPPHMTGTTENTDVFLNNFNIVNTHDNNLNWRGAHSFYGYQAADFSKKYIWVPYSTELECDEFNNIEEII